MSDTNEDDRLKWDKRYAGNDHALGVSPVAFLSDNLELFPRGKALDLAMGEGRNGVFLARHGFQVLGLDISENGLQKAHQLANASGTTIETRVVDLTATQLPENEFDLVVVTYYLQRDLFPQIQRALKPGGRVVCETYHQGYTRMRPNFRREYLLEPHELLDIFSDFHTILYQYQDDDRAAIASILAERRT